MARYRRAKFARLPRLGSCRLSLERSSRIRPIEGPGKDIIEILDEGRQLATQILDGFEVTSANDLAHDYPEHDLDLVKPGGVFGQIHEADSMAQVGQELLPAFHRLQHAAFPFLAQVAVDAIEPRHQLHQP